MGKLVSAAVSHCNSNPDFPSSCSHKSVIVLNASILGSVMPITESNVNTVGVSLFCSVGTVSKATGMMLQLIGRNFHLFLAWKGKNWSQISFLDDNFLFPETNKNSKS